MNIVKIPIEKLIPDPNNSRKHSKKNIDAIKGSLTKFGQQKPIVVSEKNIIVAGNGTVEAAKELGWKEINAVITSLDSFHQSAFAMADNKTAELAEWDFETLEQSLAQLDLGGFDIKMIGFDDIDLPDSDKIEVTGSKELDESEFSEFDHKCPKCGFEFDAKD